MYNLVCIECFMFAALVCNRQYCTSSAVAMLGCSSDPRAASKVAERSLEVLAEDSKPQPGVECVHSRTENCHSLHVLAHIDTMPVPRSDRDESFSARGVSAALYFAAAACLIIYTIGSRGCRSQHCRQFPGHKQIPG